MTVFREQCDILHEMAETSDCIIVGRCADYILHSQGPFRIFIYSDMASKMDRCRRKGLMQQNLSDRELERSIVAVNKRRAEYYEYYTGQAWGGRINYDLCVNTTQTEIKEITAAIAKLFSGTL